jgi:L-fuconolactonase
MMPIVDTHCHVSPVWYEPVESLLGQMERNGVAAAVLIQMQGQFNNEYQFACVRRHPGKFAPVVVLDTAAHDAVQTLERLAGQGASGVRLLATTRSVGDDPLLLWRAAARLGLPVSCAGSAATFATDDFAELVAALPELPIVIEHLGSASSPDGDEATSAMRRKVFALSRFPNTYIKIPGLGEFCRRATPVAEPFPFMRPIPNYLAEVYAAFGPARMMWGSDYPPSAGREGYTNALRLPLAEFEQIPGFSADDRDRIFGGTALEVFPLRG